MRDIHTETVVPVQEKPGSKILRFALMLPATLLLAMGLTFSLIYLVAGIILCIPIYLLFRRADSEYEYIHDSDEFHVDMVIRNSKRKRKVTVNLNNVLVVARPDSPEMRPYAHLQEADYSGGYAGDDLYAMAFTDQSKRQVIYLCLNEKALRGLKQCLLGKVFIQVSGDAQ